MNLQYKIGTLFVIAVGAITAVMYLDFRMTERFMEESRWVAHSHEVLTTIEEVHSTLKDVQRGQRGYLITGSESFLAPYRNGIGKVGAAIEKLREMTADNPQQQKEIVRIETTMSLFLSFLEQTIRLRDEKGFDLAQRLVASGIGKQEMDQIGAYVQAMQKEENRLLVVRAAATERARRHTIMTFVALALTTLTALAYATVRIFRDIGERQKFAHERETLISELQDALAQVRQLQGIIPICSYCKKIRDDKNSWLQMEQYISTHSDARFSHGVCPSCYEHVVQPEIDRMKYEPAKRESQKE